MTEAVTEAVTEVAPPAAASPSTPGVAKIGDLAAGAGIRRVHMLSWRDIDDVEAGGSEVHATTVARLWAEAGIEVTLRSSFAQGHAPEAHRDGYRVVRRAGRHLVFPSAALGEMTRRYGPRDALVEIWNGMPFLSPLWDRGPKVVFVHHVHAEMWRMVLPPHLARLGDTIERRLAPPLYRRTRLLTPSASTKAELVDGLGFRSERVSVVPPGIDDRFRPGGRRSPTPLIVAVGRLVPVKRYDLLIRAAAHARRHIPDLELVIIGEGYERPALQRLLDELDATHWVTLTGRADDTHVVATYQKAWLVASASAREGWGMSITEAAACATPAVATRIPGHQDSVADGHTGLLAHPHDPDALAAAITTICTDPALRHRLGQAALARAARYTWTTAATDIMGALAHEATQLRGR